MFTKLKRSLLAVGLVGAAVAVAAITTPSSAATFTVKIGTTATGSGTYSAASSTAINVTDTTTNIGVSCTKGTLTGAVPHLGMVQPVLTVTSSTWTTCTGFTIPFTIQQTGTITLTGTAASGGVTKFTVTGVNLHLTASGCTLNVTGSTDATFTNSSQKLSFAPVSTSGHVLTASAVSGCFGEFHNGDVFSYVASYLITARTVGGPVGALSITSP
jgi:hypothetical protein